MKNEFNFGSNVIHQQFGKGVVIGTDKLVRVYFEAGVIIGFYQEKCADEDRLVSELALASDWIKIDWDDENTLPEEDGTYLVSGDFCEIEFDQFCVDSFEFHDFSREINYWQPLPQPPK